LLIRYGAVALLGAAVAVLAISPFATTFVDQWSRRDVELRSALVFNSLRDELANLIAANATTRIDRLFDRLALDERLRAVGFCNSDGVLLYRSKLMPPDFSCEKVALAAALFREGPYCRSPTRGVLESASWSAACVRSPAQPSATNSCDFWNCRTASLVMGPYSPSTSSGGVAPRTFNAV
jgi:hypothetical protein